MELYKVCTKVPMTTKESSVCQFTHICKTSEGRSHNHIQFNFSFDCQDLLRTSDLEDLL